jgi:hypothetical protein
VSRASTTNAQLVTCSEDRGAISAALAQLRNSVDPCGQSGEIIAVLDKVERCRGNVYKVCTDASATRNVFDRPTPLFGAPPMRAITWNPGLRTEVEYECGGNVHEPLLRDPTASLLHELVHAAQDCDGLNPGQHELEAVRIENTFRRAAGLCQRSGYGDERLPSSMVVNCPMRPCSCTTPAPSIVSLEAQVATTMARANDNDSPLPALSSETSGDRPLSKISR